tara:strand:- start:68 stop:859 length:792 start_codon:yes stop_codon:yes gene_type:complete
MKSYKNYSQYSDYDKKQIIQKLYVEDGMSFGAIAEQLNTYANKIRRDAIKYKINVRNKSEAQSNAIKTGAHKHPTKGTERSEDTKNKIGKSIMKAWDSIDEKELKRRKRESKKRWDSLSDDVKKQRLALANQAVRNSSKVGSKLEHYLLEALVKDGYKVDFHKEQILSNTKLQIDLLLPKMNIAIEVDGPSHFLPVWGADTLAKNQKYDKKKTGLILGKGLKLLRVKQIHDFSNSRSSILYSKLLEAIDKLENGNIKSIQIED